MRSETGTNHEGSIRRLTAIEDDLRLNILLERTITVCCHIPCSHELHVKVDYHDELSSSISAIDKLWELFAPLGRQ
jgi:hypothetical protein